MKSLRLRLLAGAVAGIAFALAAAGFVLVGIFDAHVRQRYAKELDDHVLQLVAVIEAGADGGLKLKQELSEPEFRRPFSGHYWQIERDGRAILRSRSLWDETLTLRAAPPRLGERIVYQGVGPLNGALIFVDRLVELPAPAGMVLRLVVAGESGVIDQAKRDFAGVVTGSLVILGALLTAASWAQVGAGLAPLRKLQTRLDAMNAGAATRVEGDYPAEVAGLIDNLNRLIETQHREAERARSNAAQLGHGLKTPLAVLDAQARGLREGGAGDAAVSIEHEVGIMNAHVARALASARAVGPRAALGTRTQIVPLLERLIAVMKKLPGGASIQWSLLAPGSTPPVPVDPRDIEDMLGNVLDNARKWAVAKVVVTACLKGRDIEIVVEDDGPGIPSVQMDEVLVRGARLDRTIPGTGVGLSIVKDLIELNRGTLSLSRGGRGGLRVTLTLPVAVAPGSGP